MFDYNMVMLRSTKYCDRFEYISIQLSTPVIVANQRKDGYTFLINDRPSFFDWYNAYLGITFKVINFADAAGYGTFNAVAMINGAVSLISILRVKQNGIVVYDGTNLFRVTNIRDLLEMSRDYAETTGTSEYFHLDTTGTTAMAVDTVANWRAHNRGFLNRHRLINIINGQVPEVKSIIPLSKFTFFDGLRTNILPPSQIQLEFGLTHDNNLIFREHGVDPGEVVVTRFMLWIPRMIFNSEGLSYAMQ